MESFKVVRPEHLNHYGDLFGGFLLKWVDEIAWIAASRDHPGSRLVTVAMDSVEFHRSVRQGAVLRFTSSKQSQGRTSLTYAVEVFAEHLGSGEQQSIFSTCMTFVNVDAEGHKAPLPEG